MVEPTAESREVRAGIRGLLFEEYEGEEITDLSDWDELDAFIEELCGYGVERLSREPDVLTGEYVRIQKQLQNVACNNYSALIISFESSGAVRDGVADIKVLMNDLLDTIPQFSDTVKDFSRRAAEADAKRQKRLTILGEYPRLLEILEISQLMLTLVRSELHDEALELMNYTRKLACNFPQVREIQNVAAEVDLITTVLVNQLLVLLRSSIQLPMCLRVVSYLRRLNSFGENGIRSLFLQCRGRWMRSVIQSTAAPSAQGRLERMSDDTRAMMFEIVTQYRAVFLDDQDRANDSGTNILHDWVLGCIDNYLKTIADGLNDIQDGASLATILQQTMYCGQSLGRVGADFRPMLSPLFEKAVSNLYYNGLMFTLQRFRVMIGEHDWLSKGSTRASASELNMHEQGGPDSMAPPTEILKHTPLAVFSNGVLSAHNELRFCCLPTIEKELSKSLELSFLEAVEALRECGGENGIFLRDNEVPVFIDMVKVLKDTAFPYAVGCLERCLSMKCSVATEKVVAMANVLVSGE